eukprot:4819533-Alexandrium_andersonii.AAC.1
MRLTAPIRSVWPACPALPCPLPVHTAGNGGRIKRLDASWRRSTSSSPPPSTCLAALLAPPGPLPSHSVVRRSCLAAASWCPSPVRSSPPPRARGPGSGGAVCCGLVRGGCVPPRCAGRC